MKKTYRGLLCTKDFLFLLRTIEVPIETLSQGLQTAALR